MTYMMWMTDRNSKAIGIKSIKITVALWIADIFCRRLGPSLPGQLLEAQFVHSCVFVEKCGPLSNIQTPKNGEREEQRERADRSTVRGGHAAGHCKSSGLPFIRLEVLACCDITHTHTHMPPK